MMGLSGLSSPQRVRPEPSFTSGGATVPQTRLADHFYHYTKPRPANWWDWHDVTNNTPTADKP